MTTRTKMRKPKLTARERGYVPRAEAAAQLRQIADRIEKPYSAESWAPLVKFKIDIWNAKDDEAEGEQI